MFDSFKRPKRIQEVIGTAYPLISMYCRDENGRLDERLYEDEFALAYIYGMVAFNLNMIGVKDNDETGFILMGAFDILFDGKGHQILDHCNNRLNSKDAKFTSIFFTAMDELSRIRADIMKLGDKAEAKSSIQKYLNENYS
jgi:hypothetical protein